MKKGITVFFLLVFSSAAWAQQQGVQPSEAALQATSIVTQLGQMAQHQSKQIETLQSQIADLKKQLEEAKKK